MKSRSRLSWVQRNRCRKDGHSESLQSLIGNLVESLTANDWRQMHVIARRVAPRVDQAFRSHCRLAGWEGNKLVVVVDHASLVAAMRSRWSRALVEFLRAAVDGRRIERVVFRFGNTGAAMA